MTQQQDTSTPIAANAIIVSLSIQSPSFSAKDKTETEKLTSHVGIDKGAARVWKSLFPKNEQLKAVNAAERELRKFHYLNTLPYLHDGQRILPMQNLDKYMSGYRELKRKHEKAAEEFVQVYPALLEDARLFLKDMFVETDYPSQDYVRSRFSVSLKRSPLPVAETYFELGVKSEDAEEMRKELEADLQATFEAANRSLWERTYATLKNFVEQLSDPKKRIRPETIPAIKEMLSILPRINMTGDKRLDDMATALLSSLDELNYGSVRTDDTLAQTAKASTEAMCSAMGLLMGGMPMVEEHSVTDSSLEFLNAKAA